MAEALNTGHEAEERKLLIMTTQPVERLVAKLAVPTIISMLVTSVYNLADTFFVRQLESDSMVAALGISLTLMTLIQAIGFFFGHGSGNYISRAYGRHDYASAQIMASTGFVLSLLCGVILSALGLLFISPLATVLGARTAATQTHTVSYMTWILIAAPLMTGSLVLNNQLRLQGNAVFAMLGIASGAILNIVLDPILIFSAGDTLLGGRVTMPIGFGFGVAGAAMATAISQAIGFVILFIGIFRSDNVKIHLKSVALKRQYLRELVGGGLPSLTRQGISSIAVVCLNSAIGMYLTEGALIDATQAAMTGVNKITFFLLALMLGIGQGFQPVCGFNYGAKRYDRVLRAFRFTLTVSAIFITFAAAVVFVFAEPICVTVIGSSALTAKIALVALRAQMITLPLGVPIVMMNMLLQNIGKTLQATLVSMSRQGLTFLPVVMLLPLAMRAVGQDALLGIQLSQSVADVLAIIIILALGLPVIRQMREQSSTQQ